MHRPHLIVLALLVSVGLPPGFVVAHYNMLLPSSASAKRGETVTFIYQWGHPFEHELFDAPKPRSLVAVQPGDPGKTTDHTKNIEPFQLAVADGKKVQAHRFRFVAEERGDVVFALIAAPIWIEEEKEFLHDKVKVVLHVQAQKNWDREIPTAGHPLDIVPMTRPYGLQAGMVFQASITDSGKSLSGGMVEVERYNSNPPAALPADEHITRTAKTDPNGVVTCTLSEPGWWGITARRDAGTMERNGKTYPVRQRITLWVHVDEKLAGTTAK